MALPSCRNAAITEHTNATHEATHGAAHKESNERRAEQKRALWEWRRKALLDEHGKIDADAVARARAQAVAARDAVGVAATGFDAAGWRPGADNFAGRMRALNIDPRNANFMVAGAASGGLWYTDNGGASWTAVGDFLPSLSISEIVRSTANPDVLVASTGELFLERGFGGIPFGGAGEAIQGAGIYRSTNNGRAWTLVSPAPVEAFHMDISATGDVILACTETGIFRSTNLGTTWTQVSTALCQDVSFHPTDPLRVVAGGTRVNGVGNVSVVNTVPNPPCVTISVPFVDVRHLRSSDGGLTWTASSQIRYEQATPQQVGRLRCPPVSTPLTFQPAPTRWEIERHNGSTVYAVNDLGQLYRSGNDGANWTFVTTVQIGGQGWYDLALWIDRTDVDGNTANDLVVVGGVTLRRSLNGGATFAQISDDMVPGSAHDDHHLVVEHPGLSATNRTVFAVTDGGIFRAANINTVAIGGWTPLNNGLATLQFYGADTDGVTRGFQGGTQDQGGLWTTDSGRYEETIEAASGLTLGDAGFAAIDPVDPQFTYLGGTFMEIFGSQDGGASVALMGPPPEAANFIAPMILHPHDRNRLFIGGQTLQMTTNPRATTPTWTSIKPAITTPPAAANPIAAIAASQPTSGSPNVIWVVHNNLGVGGASNVFVTTVGGGGAAQWTMENFARPNRLPMRITIDPADPMHVFLAFGGFAADNLWERLPTGVWQAVNLPVAAPVRDFELDPTDPNCYMLATQVGFFVSPDRGATWRNIGPANVSIEETYWSRGHLYLATHGRGIFSQTPYATAATAIVGISCNLNGTPTTGPKLTTGMPELGLTVPAAVTQGTPNTFVALTFGDPPPAAVPPCGPQSINFFTVGSGVSNGAGAINFGVALPDDPVFAGQKFVVQAAEFTATDIIVTNGVTWTVGY